MCQGHREVSPKIEYYYSVFSQLESPFRFTYIGRLRGREGWRGISAQVCTLSFYLSLYLFIYLCTVFSTCIYILYKFYLGMLNICGCLIVGFRRTCLLVYLNNFILIYLFVIEHWGILLPISLIVVRTFNRHCWYHRPWSILFPHPPHKEYITQKMLPTWDV